MTCNCPNPICQCASRVVTHGATCQYCALGLHMRRGDDPPSIPRDLLNEERPNGVAWRTAIADVALPDPVSNIPARARGFRSWSTHDECVLRDNPKTATRVLALQLGRTERSVREKRKALRRANG